MKKTIWLALTLVLFNGIAYSQQKSTSTVNQRSKVTADVEYGTASFYHDKFIGRQTANGELFSQKKLTAAHNSLPLGTYIKVTNLHNDKSVIVKVNDRLHRYNPRLVDLSGAAATELGIKADSLIRVKVEVIKKPTKTAAKTARRKKKQ
jgi:rare lipoprotein A